MLIINNFCLVLGGIAIFMIGMEMMGANLEKAAGRNIRTLMGKATANRFAGIGTGAAITALIQSSSATTVMLVGFVNVGLMTLSQAASVIMGANIGTTISAFISALSSGGAELKVASVFAFVAFVGILMTMISKSDRNKRVGSILSGLGMIFIGLNVMSVSVNELTAEGSEVGDAIRALFASLGNNADNLTWEVPVLFLIGLVLTGIMQSSSAITAIIISLASAGLMNLQMSMCVVLGTNVGTCVTAVISSIGTTTNAKRTACVHLLFNIFGCLIFILPVSIWGRQIAGFISGIIPKTSWQIAIFHLFFNVVTTFILVWFLDYLVKLACIIVPDKAEASKVSPNQILDERILKTPAIHRMTYFADVVFQHLFLILSICIERSLSNHLLFLQHRCAAVPNPLMLSYRWRVHMNGWCQRHRFHPNKILIEHPVLYQTDGQFVRLYLVPPCWRHRLRWFQNTIWPQNIYTLRRLVG